MLKYKWREIFVIPNMKDRLMKIRRGKMKKVLAMLLCLLMVVGLLSGCKSGTEPKGETEEGKLGLVGFCTVSMSESIYVLEQEALEAIFEGKAEVQTVSCDQNSATQIQQIKNFATMGADLIIINPTEIRALADAIIEAHNAGCKIYINGATSDELGEEFYDCCTVSDEYLCGAYVAMIAKNWIEAHEAELNAANPDWELSFIISSLGEETIKRNKGELSILEEYLKDWEGNYVDASGNIVDEAGKVANPAYCKLAADHYNGIQLEQDMGNSSLNMANILATNPNTRIFLAYNSLVSTQGGQYLVDNYKDRIDEFAIFSAGVMGNEADYMVGAVSDTDGVTPSVMRGACQFGVSAAGGEVADSVAHTAYAIMYGQEGVDYFKKNPDGIAAWWTVDEKWGDGTAYVSHYSILSGATVLGFDPIEKLIDAGTICYWNSKDGYVEKTEEPTTPPAPIAPAEETPAGADVYTYSETNPFGMAIDWTLTLNADGTYVLTEKNDFVGEKSYNGKEYTKDGNNVKCGPMESGPDVFDWANPAGFEATVSGGKFAPAGVEIEAEDEPATYKYSETNPFGMAIDWTLTLNADGTYVLTEKNDFVGEKSYNGKEYTKDGDNVKCGPMASGPDVFDWANPAGFEATLNGDTFTPVV